MMMDDIVDSSVHLHDCVPDDPGVAHKPIGACVRICGVNLKFVSSLSEP